MPERFRKVSEKRSRSLEKSIFPRTNHPVSHIRSLGKHRWVFTLHDFFQIPVGLCLFHMFLPFFKKIREVFIEHLLYTVLCLRGEMENKTDKLIWVQCTSCVCPSLSETITFGHFYVSFGCLTKLKHFFPSGSIHLVPNRHLKLEFWLVSLKLPLTPHSGKCQPLWPHLSGGLQRPFPLH